MHEQLPLPFDLPDEIGDSDGNMDDLDSFYTMSDVINQGSCPACESGGHSDCYVPGESEDSPGEDRYSCCCRKDVGESLDEPTGKSFVDRVKDASAITDVQSTGRKRAAIAYPITEGMICEWSGLGKAGGGVVPIIGCRDGIAKDRHHGPDKNTLNNTEGNVHRICNFCHGRWHTLNDEFYGTRPSGTEPFIPLDPHQWTLHDSETKATNEEYLENELMWSMRKVKRVKD